MTGSVIGEPTPGFVTAQVKIRQKTYGKGYIGSTRSNEDIQFMNNRNAWIKMASSYLHLMGLIKIYNKEVVQTQVHNIPHHQLHFIIILLMV